MKNRTWVLAGNWKMNFGPREALDYFSSLERELKSIGPATRRVIFVPAYALGNEVQAAAKRTAVDLGAQNVHWEEKGAFTGELSGSALKDIGINWVLIAHSERRQYFAETDETAAKRLSRAITLGLNVVYCIGERLEERENGKTEAVLSRQLGPFCKILKEQPPKPGQIVSIAYEPVWAIGTGKTATTEQAQEAHAHIRKVLTDHIDVQVAEKLSVLYGGSVTPENVSALINQPDVDGVLVGGASLKPDGFAQILATR
jgi:triosephosphate isomerase